MLLLSTLSMQLLAGNTFTKAPQHGSVHALLYTVFLINSTNILMNIKNWIDCPANITRTDLEMMMIYTFHIKSLNQKNYSDVSANTMSGNFSHFLDKSPE